MRSCVFLVILFFSGRLWAAVDSEPANEVNPPTVRYKAGKDLNFEQLIIEGQLKRPEMSVVTGDSDENSNGLLRLRENFVDRMAEAAGSEIP